MSLRHLNIGQIRILFCRRYGYSTPQKSFISVENFVGIPNCSKKQGFITCRIKHFISTEGKICVSDYSLFRPPTHLLCMHTNGLTKIANEIVQE